MSALTITARVWRAKRWHRLTLSSGQWAATVHARDEGGHIVRGRMTSAESWPEAMQAAYKLRRDLEQELMDEVHASRASRRAEARA